MAYFNHAYQKSVVVAKTDDDSGGGQKTFEMESGELGVFNAADYLSDLFPTTGTSAIPNEFMLVLGNYNGTDTIGGNANHGGYAESIKTKIIKKNYVTGLWKADCVDAASEIIHIVIPDTCIKCDGSTTAGNQLRIDVKGDEVLRFLNRFSYVTLDYRECCDGTHAAGADVAAAWVTRINEDPLLSNFITASAISGGSTNNKLKLVIDYTATFFDNCSFDTRDWKGAVAPLKVIVSAVDDDGDPCTNTCMTADVSGVAVTDFGKNVATAVSKKAEITGETVIRDIILDGRYRQDGGWNQGNKDSARFREIEHGDALLGCGSGAVTRTSKYACYYLQHSVPRYNNPTGVFDNDQYLYKFYVLCGSDELAKMDHLWNSISNLTGVAVTDYL